MENHMGKNIPKIIRLKELGVLNSHPDRVQVHWFRPDTFFDPNDIAQVKYEMLRLVQIDGLSKKEAATCFGISRPTLYQAEADFARDGLAGLMPQQRGPKEPHKLTEEIMSFVNTCRQEQTKINARQLAVLIQKKFGITIHPRSIERAIVRKKKQ